MFLHAYSLNNRRSVLVAALPQYICAACLQLFKYVCSAVWLARSCQPTSTCLRYRYIPCGVIATCAVYSQCHAPPCSGLPMQQYLRVCRNTPCVRTANHLFVLMHAHACALDPCGCAILLNALFFIGLVFHKFLYSSKLLFLQGAFLFSRWIPPTFPTLPLGRL